LSLKVGLFFGSFNPIHIGHLVIANVMAQNTDLDKVWFVVSPQNPLKKSKTLLHEFDRYDMVRMAINDNPDLDVTDIEFRMPKPSYTIDTLVYLKEKHPQNDFVLIIGEDNLVDFPKWKNYQRILEDYSLYVYPRPKVEASELVNHARVKMINAPLLDISATYIRECIKKNHSIRYLVPDEVDAYIRYKKFFH
jgi:nicotinate-nucleotide adenylyltransferase